MADAFHVFVDGPELETPDGLRRLADAIAKHYGLGAADLLSRLQKGRFRVKTNTDRATAETYARDLSRLGARCTIEEATPANSQRTTPIPFPAVRPATPPAGTPAVPRPATPPAGTPAAPRPSTPPPVGGGPGAAALAAAGGPGSAALAAGGARASTPPPVGGTGTPSSPPPMGGNQ